MPKACCFRLTRSRRASAVAMALLAASALSIALSSTGTMAQQDLPQDDPARVYCNTTISLEKRLQLDRWAKPSECSRPTRARVTDWFLGYACVSEAGTHSCRAFVPRPGSRALDTAKGFRCIDLSFTLMEAGEFTVHRMREWATTPSSCNWDPNLGLLATEIDFDNSEICAAGACISVQRLTGIGRARLKYLIMSAFRGSDLTSAPAFGTRPPSSSEPSTVSFARNAAR